MKKYVEDEKKIEAQKKNQPKIKSIGLILFATIIGFALGYFILVLVPNDVGNSGFYLAPILLLIFFVCYMLQIFMHEIGHLIFGLLTGYSFVSFRVGQLTLIKKDGQFKFTQINLPGTGGQCLMDPPPYNDGNFPFLLYNLGGIMINLVLAAIFLLLPNESFPFLFNAFFVSFGLAGILAEITNALPIKISGIPTDGYNIQAIRKNETVKHAFWLQLKGNALLSEGAVPKDLPIEELNLKNQEELLNPLVTSTQLFRYNYNLDQMDFEKAQESLDVLTPYIDELIPVYQNEVKLEWMFLELIGENRPEIINSLFDDSFSQYIQSTANWLNRKRFFMAYEWFHNQNANKAMENYQQLNELVAIHPNTGEATMEMGLGNWLKDQIEHK